MDNFNSPIINLSLNTVSPPTPPPPRPTYQSFVSFNSTALGKLQFPELSEQSTASRSPIRLRPRFTLRASNHLVEEVENQGEDPQRAGIPSSCNAIFDKVGAVPYKKIKCGSFFSLKRPNMKVLQGRNKRLAMKRRSSELGFSMHMRISEVGSRKTLKPRPIRRCSI